MNEKYLKNIIKETIDLLLEKKKERAEDKAKEFTYQIIRQYYSQNPKFEKLSEDAQKTKIAKMEKDFKDDFFHANNSDAIIRLEPIIMKIALQFDYKLIREDTETINRLKEIVRYIKLHYRDDDFPIVLNKLKMENTTFYLLEDLFGERIDAEKKQGISYDEEKENVTNQDYKVLKDIDFNTASEYGQYSCSNSRLCYVYHDKIWKKYTNNGMNKPYLILNKNWKNIPEEHGKSTPFDAYGKSMIFLFIAPDGNIAYSNTRWNHETMGNDLRDVDHSFTTKDIENLLGIRDFSSVFEPYDKTKFVHFNAIKALRQSANPKDIFDDIVCISDTFKIYSCKLGDKYILMQHGKLMGNDNQWFNKISEYNKYNIATVQNERKKWSLIDTEGNLLSDQNGNILWFHELIDFNTGLGYIQNDKRKWSLIDAQGNILSDSNGNELWFNEIEMFNNEGLAPVQNKEGKWSIMNKKGEIFCDSNGNELWFRHIDYFNKEGHAIVQNDNGKFSLINKKGKIFCDSNGNELWFRNIYYFNTNGLAYVRNDERKWSLIDKQGNVLHDSNGNELWFNIIKSINLNIFMVQDNQGTRYFVDKNGNFYDYETREPIPSPIQENKRKNSLVITEELIKDLIKETLNKLKRK